MIKPNYYSSFKRKYISFFTFLFYRKDIKIYKQNYTFLLKVIVWAEKRFKQSKDPFTEAYLLLSHKLILDLQGAFILWKSGLYGPASGLTTAMERTIRMAGALLLKPDLIQDYLDEEKTSDLDKKFRIKFSETSLQEILDKRFGTTKRGPFINSAKSLHGSSAGIKIFYAKIRHNPDGTKGGDIIFDAFFEEEKANGIIGVLRSIPVDMSAILLEKFMDDSDVSDLMKEYWSILDREKHHVATENMKLTLKEMFKK